MDRSLERAAEAPSDELQRFVFPGTSENSSETFHLAVTAALRTLSSASVM
jgi:hypothetical protein